MKEFTQQLHEELLSKLEALDRNYDSRTITDTRLDLIVAAINAIKEQLVCYRFHTEDEEIHYFKWILPPTIALHMYYSDRIEWDRIRVQGSPECRHNFTERIYLQAEEFRIRQKLFYEYCRDGKTHMDRLYFLRDSPANQEKDCPLWFIVDQHSPTVYCVWTARLLAYTRLEQEQNRNLSENTTEPAALQFKQSGLVWTLPKINLIEIIYALKEIRAFNNGNAELVMIQECFEQIFGISLGNISRSFQEILSRKKGHTSFLDQLREYLMKKIFQIDEGNRKANER